MPDAIFYQPLPIDTETYLALAGAVVKGYEIRNRITQEQAVQSEVSSEFAWGVDEIAKVVGRDERAVYHLLATGRLPAKKIGGKWVASRSRLREFLTGEVA